MSMNTIVSLAFGAGVAAYAYSKLGKRVGYGNAGNVWKLVGVIFVLVTLVFYILLTYILHIDT